MAKRSANFGNKKEIEKLALKPYGSSKSLQEKQDWKISPKCDQILENTKYAEDTGKEKKERKKGKRVELNKNNKPSKMPNMAKLH